MRYILLIFFSIVALVSCKTNPNAKNDLNYFQDIEKLAIENSVKLSAATIQSGDQLVITVTAADNDVVAPFNKNYSSSELIQSNALSGSNTPNQGSTVISGPTYTVDAEGEIDFPTLGAISTTGKSMMELKKELVSKISRYVIEPSVSIRLANFKIAVLGEVNRQGDYTIANGQATILNALALAGDFTMYGKRNDVLVIRTENGVITHGRINVQNAESINSPFFQLKQGDVIVVSANNTKDLTSKINPNTSLYLTAASILLTAIAVTVSLFK